MTWYKKSQFTPENTQNIDTPVIMVQPFEPLVQEAVDDMNRKSPNFFQGVNKINVDMGYGQFGSVVSDNPADINININAIRQDVESSLGQSFDANNPEHKDIMINAIQEVLVHEKAHVSDAMTAQEGADAPLGGEELFPGGEGVAEQATRQFFL